jgi:hypothetical protein
MRTLGSAVGVLLALLCAATALPAAWLDRNVASEEGFVRLVAPLGTDREFQDALVDAVAQEVTAGLPESWARLVEPAVVNAASRITGLPGYPQAWENVLRGSHRKAFGEPASPPPGDGAAGPLTLDLRPLAELAAEQAEKLGIDLRLPGQLPVPAAAGASGAFLSRIAAAAQLWPWIAGIAAAAATAGVLCARRRGTALALLGAGLAAVGGAAWALAAALPLLAARAPESSGVARLFLAELAARAGESLAPWGIMVFGGGLLLLVAGMLLRFAVSGFSGRSAVRSRPNS